MNTLGVKDETTEEVFSASWEVLQHCEPTEE